MTLRIAIDAHMVGERETGNESYVLGLVRGLAQVDRQNRYAVIVLHPERLGPLSDLPGNFEVVPISPAADWIRVPFALPLLARRLGAQVLHVTYFAPPVCPCPVVVSVHDVSFGIFPRFFSFRDRLLMSTLIPHSMHRAARVIAISERTRTDIVARYGLDPERVAVTHLAPGERFRPVTDRARLGEVRARYGLSDPFILAVGNLQPRKNLKTLITAMGRIKRKGRGNTAIRLAIVGRPLLRAGEIRDEAHRVGVGAEVRFLGYVPADDLAALYSAARVFAFPSLYEGFGLPPLEAMACGTPVVASNAGALGEVLGHAAWLLGPEDVPAWAEALMALAVDEPLHASFRARGLRRAAAYSWRATAEKTLHVYEQAAGRKGS